MAPDTTVVFLHIPKTAGSTLSAVFERLYSGKPQFLAGRHGQSHIKDCLNFVNLPEEVRSEYRYVTGHIEMPVVAAVPGKPFVFTFLRDPWDRLVSLYQYVKRTPSHHKHSWIKEHNSSLEEFVQFCRWDELCNGMTRRLAGFNLAKSNDKRILQLAITNVLKYFSYVGIQESFDKSLFCLGQLLDLDITLLLYKKINVNPKNSQALKIDSTIKNRIMAMNALDYELYGFFRKQFQAKTASIIHGPLIKEFKTFLRAIKASTAGDILNE